MPLSYSIPTGEYNAGAHRSRIVGEHITTYMQSLLDGDEDAYKRQFATYRKEGIMPDMLEEMYIKVPVPHTHY